MELRGYIGVMGGEHSPYVHLLLFRCKRCNQPLAIPVRSEAGNLEKIDSDAFDVKCNCGWFQQLVGVEAARHWVATWETAQDLGNLKNAHLKDDGISLQR